MCEEFKMYVLRQTSETTDEVSAQILLYLTN
jgi:hypothetical protein